MHVRHNLTWILGFVRVGSNSLERIRCGCVDEYSKRV
jgi:hypothetical protein